MSATAGPHPSSSIPLRRIGVPSDAPEFTDFLSAVDQTGGELRWIKKSKAFPQPSTHPRSTAQINESVLQSSTVKNAVSLEAKNRYEKEDAIAKEAHEILSDMAQAFSLPSVRLVGYPVVKVLKHLFDAVYVNFEALRRLKTRVNHDPIVFVPTHRSYADFLLLSLLCFHEDFPLPAIAAGADFAQSPLMAAALRRCGAFFIRRSFGDDALYWAVFSEYIHTHLVHQDRPLEFFVEGTRSRTNKSLHPKYGLLKCLLEPFFKAQVYDIAIVPVTMTYDKAFETSLYAYELLGYPKPKETTAGLLKVRHILDKSFGNVYINFSEAISVRKYMSEAKVNRAELNFLPAKEFTVNPTAQQAIRRLGHEIVKIHNSTAVVTVWPATAASLLESAHLARTTGVTLNFIASQVTSTVKLAEKLGLNFHVALTVEDDITRHLTLNSELFVQQTPPLDYLVKLATQPIDSHVLARHRRLLEDAVTEIALANAANQLVPHFAPFAYIALALEKRSEHPATVSDLATDFRQLQNLFFLEFVFVPGDSESDFESAFAKLRNADIVSLDSDGRIRITDHDCVTQLAGFVLPFLRGYRHVFTALKTLSIRSAGAANIDERSITGLLRGLLADDLSEHRLAAGHQRLSWLSGDLIKNAYSYAKKQGVCSFSPWKVLTLHEDAFSRLIALLDSFDVNGLVTSSPASSAASEVPAPRSRL